MLVYALSWMQATGVFEFRPVRGNLPDGPKAVYVNWDKLAQLPMVNQTCWEGTYQLISLQQDGPASSRDAGQHDVSVLGQIGVSLFDTDRDQDLLEHDISLTDFASLLTHLGEKNELTKKSQAAKARCDRLMQALRVRLTSSRC